MASLFKNFTVSLKSGLDLLFAVAEDPGEVFPDAQERQNALLLKVRQAMVNNAQAGHRLTARLAQVQNKLPRLEEQAKQAVLAGQDDLARLALQRRQLALVELRALHDQQHEVQQEEHRLALVESRLVTHLETLRTRQEVIAARYTAAEAQVHLQEALGGLSTELNDLGLALEQAQTRAEDMQARAAALDQLFATGMLDLPEQLVARELTELEMSQAVEMQLAQIKERARGV